MRNAILRRQVISGDWVPINNGTCTLTDLGLRHNGNGLVWLHSGVSVHEADSDTGLAGSGKISHEYHWVVCADNKLKGKNLLSFVHPCKLDDYCLNILISSSACAHFGQRRNGKQLSTFALQINPDVRRKATDGWLIFQNPRQSDKYELLDTKRYSGLAKNYQRLGWHRHAIDYLTGIFRNDAEFSRLMTRLGYVSIRTRKITGRFESFWVYRIRVKGLLDVGVCANNQLSKKTFIPFVQASERERFGFKRIPVDGKWLYVYADHIRLLKKKRIRIDGRQLTGYTARTVKLEVHHA